VGHGTEEHLEQAEHAQHAEHVAQDPFFRRVAMTMAIVAAVLACITMLSHREHTETLRLQNEATIHHTRATDQWAYYQAKKVREYNYDASAVILGAVASQAPSTNSADSKTLQATVDDWKKKVKKYEQEATKIQATAEALTDHAKELQQESEHAHHRADRYDLGELGVELALVLCSLAVLTKRTGFWYVGIAIGIIGSLVAASAMFLH
jgi:FtsZ-binding cell division protein ZapB